MALLTMGEMHKGTVANIETYVSVYFATIGYIFSNKLFLYKKSNFIHFL